MLFGTGEGMNEGLKETSQPRIIPFLAFFFQIPMRCIKSTHQLLPDSQTLRSEPMTNRFLTLSWISRKA